MLLWRIIPLIHLQAATSTFRQQKSYITIMSSTGKRRVPSIPPVSHISSSSSSLSSSSELTINALLEAAGIVKTMTKGGWCLKEGLIHVLTMDKANLQPIIQHCGAPLVYASIESCRHSDKNATDTETATSNMKNPTTCFESLCRIVAGQQLAGAAAQSVWKRLLETTQPELTPTRVLELAEQDITTCLQKPAGLSAAKAKSIVDLAEKFHSGFLQDSFLQTASEEDVRTALLQVRGIGPWSCDMFLLFYLERPNILPLGDLGVRKGLAKQFQLKGSGKQGSLCPKKDMDKILHATKSYEPYLSLLSYYMWKVADTKDVYQHAEKSTTDSSEATKKIVTPEKKKSRKL